MVRAERHSRTAIESDLDHLSHGLAAHGALAPLAAKAAARAAVADAAVAALEKDGISRLREADQTFALIVEIVEIVVAQPVAAQPGATAV